MSEHNSVYKNKPFLHIYLMNILERYISARDKPSSGSSVKQNKKQLLELFNIGEQSNSKKT